METALTNPPSPTPAQTKRYEAIRSRASRFLDLDNARSFSATTHKPTLGILGDDGYIWVVSLADSSWMSDNGYEYAW